MLGNVALDVVIGIVFVYLLYSLYATVIMEIIASFLGLRARNLVYAIRRMLMDEEEYKDKPIRRRLSRIATSFIQMSGYATNLKNDAILKEFFKQQSIKSLTSGGVNNLPSYLNPESFTKALIDVIKIGDPELNEVARIRAGLLQLDESSVKTHLTSLMNDANYDLVKFKALVEEWFNTTMDRAGGWYKRSVQMILLVTGLFIALVFNVDTLAIIKKLSTDKQAREQMVSLAIKAIEANENGTKDEGDDASVPKKDSTSCKQQKNSALDSLITVKKALEEDIEASQNILSSAWNLSSPLHVHILNGKVPTEPKDSIFIEHHIGKDTVVFAVVHKSVDPEILQPLLPRCLTMEGKLKISPLRYKLAYFWEHLAGYLLTVLAISLGSPFWFDLLNKLVKLKTSKGVVAPETTEGSKASSSNRSIINTIG